MIAAGQVIQTEVISIVFIRLIDNNNIMLYNVILIPKYNSNLILLNQFWDNKIIYHNNPKTIVFI